MAAVDELLKKCLTLARAKETRKRSVKTYDLYLQFLKANHLEHSENSFALFLAFLLENDYAVATVKCMMYQLKFRLLLNNLEDFSNSVQVTLLFQGAKKVQKRGPPGLKQLKQPVTFELLSQIVDASSVCATSKYEEKLLKALFTMAFYGLFRVGEITFTKNPSTVILREEVKDN